jgi:hypothetical protein
MPRAKLRTMSAALKAQAEGLVSAARQAGVPETILEKLGPLQEDVLKLMMTELKMESVFRDMALIYSSLFTEDELVK